MKRLFALTCSLNLLWIAPIQATVYLTDYPHLSELKDRVQALLPSSFTIEIYGCGYENEPACLIDSFELPFHHIYAVCDGNFGFGYLRAVYKGDYNYYTRQANTGTGAVFDRVYTFAYSRETDEFDIPNFPEGYESPSRVYPLPDEFHLNSLNRAGGGRYSGGKNCFGFNLVIDYFDQASFQDNPSVLSFLPIFSKPKSGCYALAVSPIDAASDSSEKTGLRQEVFNSSSSFVLDKEPLLPDTSEVKSELIYESQNGYDKAYFAAQWVNPQCKWLPGHFRHKANFWSDISNFFSSLFF